MPRNLPDFNRRAQLTERMDEPCSREELRACLRDISKVNRWMLGYRPWFAWLDEMRPRLTGTIRILDAGCGDGNGVRRLAQWADRHGIAVSLTGLDMNADAIAIASESGPHAGSIEWIATDIFAYSPREPFHLVVSSLFTHHLDDSDVIRFLLWMEQYATTGWFINDLSRSTIPYHFFRIFAKVANLHSFVQNDGPVSIARAFSPEDWLRMCTAAGFSHGDVSIRGYIPARLCVARSKAR